MEAQTLRIEAAAKLLGIGRTSAYKAARCGEIPALRFGRRLVVPKRAIEGMLEEAGSTSSPQTGTQRTEAVK